MQHLWRIIHRIAVDPLTGLKSDDSYRLADVSSLLEATSTNALTAFACEQLRRPQEDVCRPEACNLLFVPDMVPHALVAGTQPPRTYRPGKHPIHRLERTMPDEPSTGRVERPGPSHP